MNDAIKKLGEVRGVSVKKISSFLKTKPYGGVAKNDFLNCAVEVECMLPPKKLLDEIHLIEKEGGRERNKRWDDRTLDIDIVFFGNRIIREDGLSVPHPDYINRDFVLLPIKEIAPDFVCPDNGKRIADL
jgi:2-amino-4-hydroxy-6-hydroxymethyldihydropteridine diphosphokinase